MKKINIFIGLLFCLIGGHAQLYYNFSSATTVFSTLSNATTADLTAAFSPDKTILDESFSNNIPIGFVFQFNGIDYNIIHLNSNGFANLGAPFMKGKTNDPYYERNELSAGSGFKGASRPVLAPFWDNLILSDNTGISYQLSGTAPNRIFMAQWLNMKWQGGPAAISFQLKLFETTNIIEFIYRSEAGNGGSNKSASIGITAREDNKILFGLDSLQFLSVSNSANNPIANRIIETDNIDAKPVTGQLYRFTPENCLPPGTISLVSFNDTKATIKWNALKGISEYEFALSNEDVPPFAATSTSVTKASFDGLSPATTYYFYLRSKCGTNWRRLKFTTAATGLLPFKEGFENTIDNLLPEEFSAVHGNNDFGDVYWQTTNAVNAASGGHVALNAAPFFNNNSWMYTPSFFLTKDKSYTLLFKVSTNGGNNSLEVKYGRYAGVDSMIYRLFKDTALSNTSYKQKQVTIRPENSGTYIIGFGYNNPVNNNMVYVDDISIKENITIASTVLPLYAKLTETKEAALSWQYTADAAAQFIIERSIDGIQFKEFGRMSVAQTSQNKFEFADRKPLKGISYYRVKVIQKNGDSLSSNYEAIYLKEEISTILYPNPSAKDVFVRTRNTAGKSVQVFDLSGKEIQVVANTISDQEIKIRALSNLMPGIYLVHIIGTDETLVLKWMIF